MKLINNREINLEDLESKIREAITWSFNCQKKVEILLNNSGSIGVGCDYGFHSPNDIFSFTLDYSQSENIEADIYNDYDEKYEELYKQYENDEAEFSELLDYIEKVTGSKYDEHYISEMVSQERGSLLSELEEFLVQEEDELKSKIQNVCENIEYENEYTVRHSEDDILESLKEELDYEELNSYSTIENYIVRNHTIIEED